MCEIFITRKKTYRCIHCERCFGQQTNLDRHLKKHENDGPTIFGSIRKSKDRKFSSSSYLVLSRKELCQIRKPSPSNKKTDNIDVTIEESDDSDKSSSDD
ncbi:unnamed protein product [Lepeophtheirus salmonis]|uniref:(salmon louse) hypothetical protein n=1 Tax=Lepeophtheirus salmonis TaxID=72036 RepID=A0A7R8CGI1_LEPSM|nr:unnamed protein product [Lepeophtheirus salmonis]CAF2816416.1 unnamed protein product [Lepeophtheirus salmonis]